jgi:nucleotide-binding universal stress UspA family protein
MYTKILVPLDGSPLAECSLEHLKTVVQGQGAPSPQVILLRAVEPVSSNDAAALAQAGYMIADVEARKADEAKEYLFKMVDRLSKDGIAARDVVVFGRAAEAILDYAQKNGIDLIVMSSHGRSGISRFAFGSVSDRVVRHSTIPVLLVSAPGCRLDNK